MLRKDIFLLLLAMTAVTYLPRALPAVLMEKLHFHGRVEKFLNLIPYTAMAALIFPGVLTVDASRPWIGLVGAAAAAIPALMKKPVMLSMLCAIAVEFLLYFFL